MTRRYSLEGVVVAEGLAIIFGVFGVIVVILLFATTELESERDRYKKALTTIRGILDLKSELLPDFCCRDIKMILDHEGITSDAESKKDLKERIKDPTLG